MPDTGVLAEQAVRGGPREAGNGPATTCCSIPSRRTFESDGRRDLRVAVGAKLGDDQLENWYANLWEKERLTGLNVHVKYLHTKYMIATRSARMPCLVTGSANFSDASTRNNDENMLVIRGDDRVVDIYLTEFMRIFAHYRAGDFGGEDDGATTLPRGHGRWTKTFFRDGIRKTDSAKSSRESVSGFP